MGTKVLIFRGFSAEELKRVFDIEMLALDGDWYVESATTVKCSPAAKSDFLTTAVLKKGKENTDIVFVSSAELALQNNIALCLLKQKGTWNVRQATTIKCSAARDSVCLTTLVLEKEA